jgi:hypothetical protein
MTSVRAALVALVILLSEAFSRRQPKNSRKITFASVEPSVESAVESSIVRIPFVPRMNVVTSFAISGRNHIRSID